MHSGQDGSELFVFQTILVLRITVQKLEAILATGELKPHLKDVLLLLYMLCLGRLKVQFTEGTYRLDAHAFQL